jgi:hypothetical protein
MGRRAMDGDRDRLTAEVEDEIKAREGDDTPEGQNRVHHGLNRWDRQGHGHGARRPGARASR